MAKRTLIFALSLFTLSHWALPRAVAADGTTFEPISADALVKGCVVKSQPDFDTGVPTQMRAGGEKLIRCLEEIVLDQAAAMIDPAILSPADLRTYLDEIGTGYQKIYWLLYNENRKCGAACENRHVFHLGRHGALLERLIRDMVHERNEKKF